MFYLVECNGRYDDYREEAIEFSENKEYLETKAVQYNEVVLEISKLRRNKVYHYCNGFEIKIALEVNKMEWIPLIEKPLSPPKTKEDHARWASIKERNGEITQQNNEKLIAFKKKVAEKYIQDEIPRELQKLFYIGYNGNLECHMLSDLGYMVKETVRPFVERFK